MCESEELKYCPYCQMVNIFNISGSGREGTCYGCDRNLMFNKNWNPTDVEVINEKWGKPERHV